MYPMLWRCYLGKNFAGSTKAEICSITEMMQNHTKWRQPSVPTQTYIFSRRGLCSSCSELIKLQLYRKNTPVRPSIEYQTIGGIVSKETVCCVGGKVKH